MMKLYVFYNLLIIVLVTSFSAIKNADASSFSRVCYFSGLKPSPSRVNATLCSHIIAGFSSVKNGLIDLGDDSYKKMYRDVIGLKESNPDLKVLLTVGGGGNMNGFSEAFNSLLNRTRFIASVLTVLNDYEFDGFDVDWEFPVWNDYVPEDKENFMLFLKEFKFGAMLYSSLTGKSLLLTVAVAAPKTIVDKSYDIPEMAKYVDFINLMSYDFHDYFWYTPFTGHNSPLFNRSVEEGYFATLNTAWSAFYWNQQGMPKSKIMVGIPTYGHTYKLLDPDINGVDAPATGIGIKDGDVSYSEVCNFLLSGGVQVFDNESQVPYLYKDYDWISYEDVTSILGKAKWIKENEFGGAMTFDLNSDDWECTCSSVPFPLHTVLYHAFTNK